MPDSARAHIVGRPVLIVVDIQGGSTSADFGDGGIPSMSGRQERAARVRTLIANARAADVPVVFIQEVHKRSLVDIGRELDGAEGIHCLEGDAETELASWLEPQPDEFVIRKRRYSAFFGTELEIALKAYRADTVVLVGGLTDVCIHYTAVDAHQHDYHVRVVSDGVGGSTPRAHDYALEAIRYLQRDALIDSRDMNAWFTSRSNGSIE
ncbi:nicotinamidase-related amidase [Microbacterium endophyticum]|uniref:Nicotinamidase-related amidase n=1 Tax=Microbacterium endophyticum TaxID=1526412 RepID=A0A7W4YLN3_9MICO|nr:cysteine hydrolase [Microbacterium endophyticum]MBB2975353.1 nicotinamidase-related amidase [Microbacterium endophyticum]NIK35628.1 nicotinamidase-related amidase [Microbacterium endophyticum]